ncbi:MAG: Mrp/NBP35 family ATP-binding protein [Ignavibacteria bacterium]|nr:Mrp/NBP35 family ATP-binding protein [Ignavibacteria bacterium]
MQLVKHKIDVPNIKNIVAITSGKGGVGKSTVSANLAVTFANMGMKVGLFDGDIFGPSIPIMFGIEDEKPEVYNDNGVGRNLPIMKYGVKLISIGNLVDPKRAVVWRGPLASKAITEILLSTNWDELDILLVDTPPGTSDIHISVVQELPLAGAVIVTTPQKVAVADSRKTADMFRVKTFNVTCLGVIENFSYFQTDKLPNEKFYLFGQDGGKHLAEEIGTDLLGQIPIIEGVCSMADMGIPAAMDGTHQLVGIYKDIAEKLLAKLN